MKFKIKKPEKAKHTDIVNGATWISNNNCFTVSDDNTIMSWNTLTDATNKISTLDNSYLDIDCFPNSRSNSDFVAIAGANGSIKLITKLGKIEKTVANAHTGSITALKWSSDGAGLASCGEDGCVKIWSKNGELRSKICEYPDPIYSLAWSPDCNSVCITKKDSLEIIPITTSNS